MSDAAGGRLAEQTDEGANEVTRYSYDRAGRRVRMQSGNRDVTYRYGRDGELLRVSDNSQRLEVSYEYDVRGRETRRIYGNGVRQETLYDAIGRVIMIRETGSMGRMLRAEGYLYDAQGRRSHGVDEEGRVTKYEYDVQSRLSTVLYPWTEEKAGADRVEAEEAGLYFTPEKGTGERYTFTGAVSAATTAATVVVGVAGNDLVNNAWDAAASLTTTMDGSWGAATMTALNTQETVTIVTAVSGVVAGVVTEVVTSTATNSINKKSD